MIVNGNMAYDALAHITAGNENKVYENGWDAESNSSAACTYQRDDEPDCGVGRALHHLGMTVAELKGMDNCGTNTIIGIVPLPQGWYLTNTAIKVFAAFQRLQDTGHSWGIALAQALDVLRDPMLWSADGGRW